MIPGADSENFLTSSRFSACSLRARPTKASLFERTCFAIQSEYSEVCPLVSRLPFRS